MATTKFLADVSVDGALSVTGSYGLSASDIPSLAASKITSGTFSTARIPSLAASKITSGTFADARIASAANWNSAYNNYITGIAVTGTTTKTITLTQRDGGTITTSFTDIDNNTDTNYYLNGITKSGNTLTFSVSGATNQTYTFGSNAFNSTTIPTNNNQLTNGAGYITGYTVTSSDVTTALGYTPYQEGTALSASTGAFSGDITVSGNQVITTGTNADVKFSVWSGTTYGIGMTSGVTYGGLNDYAMTFCMNNDSDRGFWWGYSGQTKSSGAMSLTTAGVLTVASSITAGGAVTGSNLNVSNWDTAYSWGDHASAGYLTAHPNITAASSSNNSGRTYIQDITVDSNGHVTGISTATETVTDTNTTYSTATSSTLGLVKIGYTENGKNYPVELSSGKMFVNVPWTDTNTTYSVATTSANGLMSSTDKSKLDGIAANANNYVHPTSAGNKHIPSGGAAGQFLKYSSSGTAVWATPSYTTNTDTITSVGVSGSETTGTVTFAASGSASISQVGSTVTISATNTTYSEYNGGSAGLVPSGSGGTGKFLQEDGQWAIPADNNTTYSAGAGLDLSGTTFSVESNLAGDVYTIGRDGNDKYTVNTTNHAWYLDGVLDMRLNNNGNLDVDGDVIAYSTVTSSDRKLKTDIETLENASEKVSALRGVSFTWNHGRKAGTPDIGLIAQEVEEVVPEIVGESELLDGTMAKHVDYPKVVALLIEAHKEQQDIIAQLEERIIDLENRL